MKKIVSIAMVIGLILSLSITGFAQTIDNKEYGISFTLSDDWTNKSDDDGIAFDYRWNGYEYIYINAVDNDIAYSMELIDEKVLKDLCKEMHSDWNLASNLRKANNNAFVTVKTNSEIENYEYYNDTKYYRYEKAYTASAIGYYDMSFYLTTYVTAKNGKIYLFTYERNNDANHFSDFVNVLNNVSFKNGEVKIEIDGERIYPDTAPMLIDGRTLVPIRAVAEKMGYSVAWDNENQLVILTSSNGKTILHFEIGSNIALKNLSKKIELDVPAIIVGGRTYLPLRAVAEAMDAKVNWNGDERIVEITQ